MATLKKYDFSGKEIGEVKVNDKDLDVTVSGQMIKDYLVAIRKNARQWSANTKGRKEVNATGKKPHRQKGLGRARQGCLAAPQYKGGGVVFGPKPKFDQHVRINKKERNLAVKSLLSEKIKANNVILLSLNEEVSKTKQVSEFYKKLSFSNTRVLVLAKDKESNGFKRCTKNIQKTQFILSNNINGYNLALCQNIIIIESAFEDIKNILGKNDE